MTVKELVDVLSHYNDETEVVMDTMIVKDPKSFTLLYSVNAITGHGEQIEFVFLGESD